MNIADPSIYTDFSGLTGLKAEAVKDSDAALDKVAHQFESLMVQQMLKSMREASLGEGLLDNDQSLMYRDMYDKQLAIHLSEAGGLGLAEMIKQQLGGDSAENALPAQDIKAYRLSAKPNVQPMLASKETSLAANDVDGVSVTPEPRQESWTPESFVQQLWPWAREAASMLGMKPQALLAQAALETGWGRHMIQNGEGQTANNLFGIKADSRWSGDRVSVPTMEYEEGVAVRKSQQFRAYSSLQDSFQDYVAFLKANPRYQQALEVADDPQAYFGELQRAGYATDPQYANKIQKVMEGSEMQRAMTGI
ncbi:MAG: flagellar assembly peptidoglycan hydrolase FlgJ [Gammaproteobacteria bacterium]|nr:flagellar assembly peptidoglycan hydrolase FlgJ [Gammaproteobacteria bacterium]